MQRKEEIARSTVAHARRPRRFSWPVPATLTDRMLEAMLYASAGPAQGGRRKPEPDWTNCPSRTPPARRHADAALRRTSGLRAGWL